MQAARKFIFLEFGAIFVSCEQNVATQRVGEYFALTRDGCEKALYFIPEKGTTYSAQTCGAAGQGARRIYFCRAALVETTHLHRGALWLPQLANLCLVIMHRDGTLCKAA